MVLYFLLFILILLIIIEILTILFRLTGLPDKKARFQVISLLTGSGFTTRESELITSHPKRRQLAEIIMIIGSLSTVTLISFLINILKSSFTLKSTMYILIFILFLFIIKRSKKILPFFDEFVEKSILKNKIQTASTSAVYEMINSSKGYGLYTIYVDGKSDLIGKPLENCKLKNYKIQILNIDKGDKLVNTPKGDYVIEQGDLMLIYGKIENITKFFKLNINNDFKEKS